MKPIRFHWRLVQGGEQGRVSRALGSSRESTGLPDLKRQIAFCQAAEEAGIDALLVDIGAPKPDPLLLTAALGMNTQKIGFIVAARSGLIPPTTFVQQVNTLSTLIGGDRLLLNIVAGHSPVEQRYYGDFLDHDQRYARTEEYLAICRALWRQDRPLDFDGRFFRVEGARLNTPFLGREQRFPLLFIAGGSDAARDLAISQGSCWMRLPDAPEKVGQQAKAVLGAGKELGLRLSVMARSTHEKALEAAHALVATLDPDNNESGAEKAFVGKSDSVSFKATYRLAEDTWLTPTLWTGAVRTHGAPAICLVGSADEVADALLDYARVGVSHFILSGWPKLEEMMFFGQEVIPRVRKKEKAHAGSTVV